MHNKWYNKIVSKRGYRGGNSNTLPPKWTLKACCTFKACQNPQFFID